MSAFSKPTRPAHARPRPAARQRSSRRHYLEYLEQRQLLSGTPNPPPVQTYYLPFPAADVLTTLKSIHSGPKAPVSTYISISVAEDGTLIYYNPAENGNVSDIANPTPSQIYNSLTNPGGVQIWGDGNPADGSPPGDPSNTLQAGQVIILSSPAIPVPRTSGQIYFGGGDEIAATKSISIGELNYAAGTGSLLAGALNVDPTSQWGTSYTIPVGQNTSGASGMFNYTGLEIMAQTNGTVVKIATSGNGKVTKTVTLNQGQSYLVNNGVKQGATVVASAPVEVDEVTGNPAQTYASRWFALTPTAQWSSSYYTSVSTEASNPTAVFVYNPSSSAIAVTEETRGAGGTAATLTTVTVNVPAKGTARVMMPAGSGAHFYTAGGQAFYAVSTTDFGSYNYEWGTALIPQNELTTQAIVGLGLGRDPTSSVDPTQNGSPVWVTPIGNGNTPVTVYVSYNGNDTGPLVDPNGFHYDVALSLTELQTAKVFNPDGNQSGMLLYTLNPNVKLAVAWGEDPASASAGEPGLDAGTNVVPLPDFDAGESASLFTDANSDGVVSPGDTLRYTIVVNNISRTTLADLQLTDALPANLTYVDNTLSYTITPHGGTASSPVSIPDAGTAGFSLASSGLALPTLQGGATYTLTFEAMIANMLPTGQTDILDTGVVNSPSLSESDDIQADTPVYYDIGGLVFQDTNRNGVADAGEPGLAGVDVNLLKGTTIVATATTDATGHYLFIAPPLANYTVNVVNSSVEAVLPNSVQTAGVNPTPVSLTGGGALTTAAAEGYMTLVSAIPSKLGGSVTDDGVGLAGVSLTLTGTNASGTITPQTVVTDASGNYLFVVMTGTYTITETQPAGLLAGPASAGNFGGTVAPIPGNRISGIALPGDAIGANYNFTDLKPAEVTGLAYADANDNGIFNPGEAPLAGVKLTLTGTNDLGTITSLTTTTGTDGSYSFGMLRPGTYTVTETQPAGYLNGLDALNGTVVPGSSTTNAIAAITLLEGVTSSATFGSLPPAGVSGYVYVDANDNGIMDAGEAPVGGVKLTLTGTNDVGMISALTVTTATDGSYNFGMLRPGTYTVTETQPAGYLNGLEAQNGAVIPGSATANAIGGITLTAGGSSSDTFGELIPGTVTGSVYVDANNNGLKDAGEAPLGGVVLTLTGTNDLGVITPVAVTTAANGSYSFGNLRPGTYTVTETQPAGYLNGLDNENGAVIAGSNTTSALSNLTLGSGGSTSVLFGELQPASVSGFVYVDANNNGNKDTGEASLGGVQLTLTGTNDLGAISPLTTTTGADGSYTFGTLRPGTYTVTATQPAGYLGGLEARNGVVIPGSNTTNALSNLILGSGGTTNVLFGELAPASVSGFVYADANNNGVKDPGDAPISGVQLTLSGTNDQGTISALTTTTAADGSYSFGNLRPGTYTVTVSQPAGYFSGLEARNGVVIPGSNTVNAVSGLTLNSGGTASALFGELPAGSISGFVYVDANDNGVKDAGEAPVGGVTLTLTGTNDLGPITPITITSATDGSYSFGMLRPGTYAVTETQPAGYLHGLEAANGVVIPGSTTTSAITGIAVLSSAIANNNFGELLPAKVSGLVYVDANDNGVKDAGEAPVGGVVLTLSGTNDLGAIATITTTTATDGSYSFGNLCPGTYTVTETQPAGYLNGLDAVNGTVIPGSNTASSLGGLTLSSGGGDCVLFGELRPATITGFVFIDANNNGVKDGGETPIADVVLQLSGTNDIGAVTSVTTTTATDGSYTFGNLRPGTYTVTESQPAGYLQGKDAKNGAVIAGISTPNAVTGLTVGSNGAATATFGELLPAVVSGYVFVDANDNGIKDAGEAPLSGVTLTLSGTNDLGTITPLTVTTATTGTYTFGNLRPGTYSVTETQPAGYLNGLEAKNGVVIPGSSTTNAVTTIIVGSGGTATAAFGELRPSSLSGFVYVVNNNNCCQGSSQTPLAGVKITLTGTNDLGTIASISVTTGTDGSYTFTNLRPGTYAISDVQPTGYTAGTEALGTAGGTIVKNGFTQIILTTNQAGINYNFAELKSCTCGGSCGGTGSCDSGSGSCGGSTGCGNSVCKGQAATIGFWQNKNGQSLINCLNGGSTSKQLGNWLATNFPNLYGSAAGACNLAGKTNAAVAALYLKDCNTAGAKLNAEVLATALAVYVTNSGLAGAAGASCGFNVNTSGLGGATFSVGTCGSAFGIANGVSSTVMNILLATNASAKQGVPYGGNASLCEQANTIYDGINTCGDIS